MTPSKTTSLTRKIVLGFAAAAVSAMTLAGANQAKAGGGFSIHLGFGSGSSIFIGSGGYGCDYYKHKWYNTGHFYWKKKYYKCMGWW